MRHNMTSLSEDKDSYMTEIKRSTYCAKFGHIRIPIPNGVDTYKLLEPDLRGMKSSGIIAYYYYNPITRKLVIVKKSRLKHLGNYK